MVRQDFFISYNKADRSWAEWIAWQLEEVGYTTVLQAWDFRPGTNFVLAMQHATATATRTIAVLSPNYLAARFTQPEWAAAFAQDPTGSKGMVLPVRIQECNLEGLLGQIVYIDLLGLDEVAAQQALLAGPLRSRAKPTVAPSFPGSVTPMGSTRPPFPTPAIPAMPSPAPPSGNRTVTISASVKDSMIIVGDKNTVTPRGEDVRG